jgi:hypothetical protein
MQRLFCRVRIDPETLESAGEPEQVACGMMGDDFVIDEDEGVAYVTTHRQNIIERALLVLGNTPVTIAGEPFIEHLVGPTNGVWGRQPGGEGQGGVLRYGWGNIGPDL